MFKVIFKEIISFIAVACGFIVFMGLCSIVEHFCISTFAAVLVACFVLNKCCGALLTHDNDQDKERSKNV